MLDFVQNSPWVIVLFFAVLYLLSTVLSAIIGRLTRTSAGANTLAPYLMADLAAHAGQRRLYLQRDADGRPLQGKGKTDPEFGELLEVVRGKPGKNLFLALLLVVLLAAVMALFRYADVATAELDSPLWRGVAAAFLAANALLRLWNGSYRCELYQNGLVAGPGLRRRRVAYSDIVRTEGQGYIHRRMQRGLFSLRDAWVMGVVLRDGTVLELSDVYYAAARKKLGLWAQSLYWEGDLATPGAAAAPAPYTQVQQTV